MRVMRIGLPFKEAGNGLSVSPLCIVPVPLKGTPRLPRVSSCGDRHYFAGEYPGIPGKQGIFILNQPEMSRKYCMLLSKQQKAHNYD